MPIGTGFASPLLITSAADDRQRRLRRRPGALAAAGGTLREELWLRAVVAGGQGRYASAYADLAAAPAGTPRRPVGVAGAQHPGVALASARLARRGPRLGRPRPRGGRRRSPRARVDALIGLAADALGVGRFAASAAALRRAQGLLDGGPPRLAGPAGVGVGRTGDGDRRRRRRRSVTPSGRSSWPAALGSARHRVKSDVVLAAALCSDGRLDRSRAVADAALDTTQRSGTHPAELGVGVPARRNRQRERTPQIKSLKFATSALIRCGAEAACC